MLLMNKYATTGAEIIHVHIPGLGAVALDKPSILAHDIRRPAPKSRRWTLSGMNYAEFLESLLILLISRLPSRNLVVGL